MRISYLGALTIVVSWLLFFALFWAAAQGFLLTTLEAFRS